MNNFKHKLLGFVVGLAFVGSLALAQDWYVASGKPVQRALLNSADLRTEFASIETNIAGKLPALTGNGDKIVVVNSAGTALTVATTGVAVSAGGTGATTAAGARTSLGLAIGTDVQAYDADLAAIAALANTDSNFIVGNGSAWVAETGATARTSLGLGSLATASTISDTNWSGTDLAVANGGTGSSTAADARTALGLAIGSDVQAYDADLAAIAALANTDSNFIVGNGSAWVAETGATVRTSLGLGSLATASTINDGNWSGTDLAIGNGGTGSSSAANARTALGLAISSDVQAYNTELQAIASLAVTDGNFIVGNGSTFVAESGATALASMGAAADASVVHLAGSETVTGTKSFTARPITTSAGGFLSNADSNNTGGSIIITNSTPSDTTGMNPGDIKLVY